MRRFAVAIVAVGAVMASWCGSAAATTNPDAIVLARCWDGAVRAQFQYSGMSPMWHLRAEEAVTFGFVSAKKTYLFDGPVGADAMTVRLPAGVGPFTATVTTTVYGGAGRVKAEGSATITCRKPPPPPPPPVRVGPKAWAQGPCGDPMYRFWLKAGSARTTFTVRYNNFDRGWTSFSRTVARGGLVHTAYHHVRGFTRMTISARGHVLYSRLSAAPGNYRTCW